MHYPWWYVPVLTAPMLIAAVAVLHVLVSHYAVGGGLFLAVETSFAYRTKDEQYLDYLRGHTGFFVLLTVVFGAITGVGIWWTIGLASPLSTEVLIRTFVFGWATEYVFFVVEIVSVLAFYSCWGRLAPKTHAALGWIYGLAAWASLVLITGITAFMLNPGAWPGKPTFWVGFFNPQFVPQTLVRTGGALLLSSLYVYLHASIALKDGRLRELIARRSARPALLGAILLAAGGLGWFGLLPESARALLERAAVLNLFMLLILALTAAVLVLVYLGPYRNPGWLSPGFAGALALLGIGAFGAGEFVREAVRKPYVLYRVVYGNQVFASQVDQLRRTGYLEGGTWTRAFVEQHYADRAGVFEGGQIKERVLLGLPEPDRVRLGQVLFQYHCNDCHAAGVGYSAVGPLVRGRDWDRNWQRQVSMITHLNEAHFFMPPWAGTAEEAELLAAYLSKIAPPRPPDVPNPSGPGPQAPDAP
ncbi:MAG: cytochrome ubiquinol oxidase subunit I [Thermoguttaceae bacterium]